MVDSQESNDTPFHQHILLSISIGILPSFSSFSNLAISCKLFALRISFSTRFFSFSVSFTLYVLSPDAAPFAAAVPPAEGISKVWDLTPMICAVAYGLVYRLGMGVKSGR
jgi:hypothetical protein